MADNEVEEAGGTPIDTVRVSSVPSAQPQATDTIESDTFTGNCDDVEHVSQVDVADTTLPSLEASEMLQGQPALAASAATATPVIQDGASRENCDPMNVDLPDQAYGTSTQADASTDRLELGAAFYQSLPAQDTSRNIDTSQAPGSTADHPAVVADDERSDAFDSEDAEARRKFAKAKRLHKQKQEEGLLTVEEHVEFNLLESAENKRIKKLAADREYAAREEAGIAAMAKAKEEKEREEAETLFVPESRGGTDSGDAIDEDLIKVPKKRRKKREQAASANDADGPTKPAKRARCSTGAKTAGKQKKGAKAKENPMQVLDRHNMRFVSSVIKDAQATANLPAQPQFHNNTSKKAEALAQLISTVQKDDLKEARKDKAEIEAAIKKFDGQGSLHADRGVWICKGMRTGLKNFQVVGAGWLREREKGFHKPYGGILADEMGLGKTVMMCANIINGKAKSGEPRPTLVVAAPALCEQWEREIRKHCFRNYENAHGFHIITQFRSPWIKHLTDVELMNSDVILTTYAQVAKSFPKQDFPPELVTPKQRQEWWDVVWEKDRGLLHRIKFHRVVLDEAQVIKNHNTRTSLACRFLDAKNRWAVTGTPVSNSLAEFYAFLKFLDVPNTGTFKIFKRNFRTDKFGTTRLQAFLQPFMLRRTHLDRFFGARLLDLPPPSENVFYLEFSIVERQIYEIVKKRFIKRINTMAKDGSHIKGYATIWTMLLRLRQLTSHILCIQETLMELIEREDFEKLRTIILQESECPSDDENILLRLRHMITMAIATKGGNNGEDSTAEDDFLAHDEDFGDSVDFGGEHGRSMDYTGILDSMPKSKGFNDMMGKQNCYKCQKSPTNPHITSCSHIYCLGCLELLQHEASRKGQDGARCLECGDEYTSADPCFEPDLSWPELTTRSNVGGGKKKNRNKAKKKHKNAKKESSWIEMGPVCASAKTRAVKARIQMWFEEDKKVERLGHMNLGKGSATREEEDEKLTKKIIIFTQFLPVVRILEKLCESEKWQYCTYTGAMTQPMRQEELEEFRDNKDKRILIASLMAGGVGLNLTEASRCINMDPWWNKAVEEQAFARIYRIGQTEETCLNRLVVRNSIDTAMHAMQERKSAEIGELMDASSKNWTVEEMMELFGEVGHDNDGNAFIFTEEDGSEEDGSNAIEPECMGATAPPEIEIGDDDDWDFNVPKQVLKSSSCRGGTSDEVV